MYSLGEYLSSTILDQLKGSLDCYLFFLKRLERIFKTSGFDTTLGICPSLALKWPEYDIAKY